MAINCEFINLIIPINKIDVVYPGGFQKFKEEHSNEFFGRFYHDNLLFRDGAMNYKDLNQIVKKWEAKGLHKLIETEGKKLWLDFCVFDSMSFGKNIPCNWLDFDVKNKCVSLKAN